MNSTNATNPKKLFVLIILLILLIPLSILFASFINRYLSPQFPSMKVTQRPIKNVTISENPQTTMDPQKKMLNLIQNRPSLSTTDLNAKKAILSLLPSGQDSGTVYQSDGFMVEYVHSLDLFQVEIDKDDVEAEKAAAIAWFEQNGLSKNGLCNLPVTFYLNYQLDQEYRQNNLTFNPLPESC